MQHYYISFALYTFDAHLESSHNDNNIYIYCFCVLQVILDKKRRNWLDKKRDKLKGRNGKTLFKFLVGAKKTTAAS